MNSILIAGCGDVALRAIPLLTSRYRVFALVRNPARCARLRAMGVMPILGDLDDRASLSRIAGLADAVLHFAPPSAENPPSPPLLKGGDCTNPLALRFPPFAKGGQGGFAFADTHTRNLLSILSQGKAPKRLVYISTSGVYGDCGGAWVSETHPLNAQTARAQRRVDAERQIRDWAKRNRVNAVILRVPGIYAADRLPLDRLRAGTPAIVQEEDSYTNLIHADDLARIGIAALQRGKSCRVYHASDDSQLKMGEYFDLVADAYRLPHMPRISRAEAQRVLPETLLSFMNESRRLANRRMKRELKAKLDYPSVADMLAAIEYS
ncbi:MAG: SDR family oxidoreductase [Gallionella sp.]|nr:SDR family oxidoreductase [Gallionella sp.]